MTGDVHACAGEQCRLCAYRQGRPDPSGGPYQTVIQARDAQAKAMLYEMEVEAEASQRRQGRPARARRTVR